MKPHIKRPTADEISAILAPSYEYEKIELHKPAYDYLASCLNGSRAEVSMYVSNRITSELVRLSKMKDGTGGHPHKGPASEETRNLRRKLALKRWEGVEKKDRVRVRVFEEPHKAYQELSDNQMDRSDIASSLVAEQCELLNPDALADYCDAHPGKPQKFVSLRKYAVDAAKEIATRFSLPFSKIICYILEQES